METSKTFTDSKTVAKAEYDQNHKVLTITFVTGKSYAYASVLEDVWLALLKAESIGKFVNDNIKEKYMYTKIN